MSNMEVDDSAREITMPNVPADVSETKSVNENKESNEENSSSSGDTVPSSRTVMAEVAPGSVSVSLHPLVLLNISDHWTRQRAQNIQNKEGSDAPGQVYGAIIGKQTGREVEVMNSFELKYDVVGGLVFLSTEYYKVKEEQYKQVFSDMDLLGWYTTGGEANDKDLLLHRQVCQLVEGPLLLKLDPSGSRTGELGVSVYESVVVGTTDMQLVMMPYTLATEEAERVGVDHVARMATHHTTEQSNVSDNLNAQASAVRMLVSRVQVVVSYVEACEKGELSMDPHIMRQISSLAHRLPILENENFNEEFYTQSNDVALLAYLGAITKSLNSCNKFLNRFNLLHDRHTLGRKMRGLLF